MVFPIYLFLAKLSCNLLPLLNSIKKYLIILVVFDTCKSYDIVISTITKEKKLTCERVCVSSRVTEVVCSWMKTYIRKSSSSSCVLNITLSCLHTRLINFTYMNLREEFQKSQFINSEWPRQVNVST